MGPPWRGAPPSPAPSHWDLLSLHLIEVEDLSFGQNQEVPGQSQASVFLGIRKGIGREGAKPGPGCGPHTWYRGPYFVPGPVGGATPGAGQGAAECHRQNLGSNMAPTLSKGVS
jgi:hypothetical protein